MTGLRIGDSVLKVSDAVVDQEERVSLSFDAKRFRPVLMPLAEFEATLIALDCAEILGNEPEHKGKVWANFLRNSGIPIGKAVYSITTHPDFKDKGMIVGMTEEAEEVQPDQVETPIVAQPAETPKEPNPTDEKAKAKK